MTDAPNVLLASVDCLRGDAAYGERAATPFLNEMADDGLVFERMFSTGAWTAPAFVGLLTGEQPHSYSRDLSIHAYPETLAETLRSEGYRTVAELDANYWISATQGFDRGFDAFHNHVDADSFVNKKQECASDDRNELAQRLPDALVERFPGAIDRAWNTLRGSDRLFTLAQHVDMLSGADKAGVGAETLVDRFLDEAFDGDRPFFGWIHFMDVHHPYLPEMKTLSDRVRFPRPLVEYVNNASVRPGVSLGSRGSELLEQAYNRKVTEIDERLRGLVEAVRSKSDREVVVVVVGDHGEEFREHGRFNHHNKPYNELIHVPCLVAGAGTGHITRNTSFLDFKTAVESVTKGGSFAEAFETSIHECRYLHHDENITDRTAQAIEGRDTPAQCRTIIDRDLKIHYDHDAGSFELYDLATDFGEQTNRFDPDDHELLVREAIKRRLYEQQELDDQQLVRSVDH